MPTLAPLALDLDDPIANEVAEMLYLLERPCVLDATGTTRVLGSTPARSTRRFARRCGDDRGRLGS